MSEKPTLLLLHGALYTRREFDPLQRELGAEYRIVSFDFPGHGERSREIESFSIDRFVQETLDRIDSLGSGPVHIFGFSMGGYVGLEAAARSLEGVQSVMTLGTKFLWTSDEAVGEIRKLDPDKIEAKVPPFADRLRQRHGEGSWRDVLSRTADMMIELGDRPVLTDSRLGIITQPVRIALGDRDSMVGFDETIASWRSLPNATLQVFPGTPHALEQVDSDRLAEAIRQFHADSSD